MSNYDKGNLSQHLSELSDLVNAYNPLHKYFFAAVMAAVIAIGLIVIQSVGLLPGIMLLGLVLVGVVPILVRGSESYKRHPSEKEFSERACQIMSSCINLYKHPGDDPLSVSHRIILSYEKNGNLTLYKEFISIFPHMASGKLRKLSSVKLG